MKIKQIFKGILNIAIGFTFFGIKFYTIQPMIMDESGGALTFIQLIRQGVTYSGEYFMGYFNEIFKQNGINLILALLFIAVGVLELLQIKGMKSNGN